MCLTQSGEYGNHWPCFAAKFPCSASITFPILDFLWNTTTNTRWTIKMNKRSEQGNRLMLDPLWKNSNSHLKMFWNFEIKEIEVLLSLAVWSHSICWLCKKEHDSGVAFIGLMRRLPFVDQVAQMPKRNKKGGKAVLFVTFQLCMFSFPVLGPLCTKGRIQYPQTCNFLPSVL